MPITMDLENTRCHQTNSRKAGDFDGDFGMDDRCQPSPRLPEVFDFSKLSFESRRDDFLDILVDSKPFEVEQAFAYRVGEAAGLLIGRQAVWRSLDLATDILIEMMNVMCDSFPIMVKVSLVEPLCCQPSSSSRFVNQDEIESYLKEHKNCVDVVELFPVHDDLGELDDGAFAIEQTRFFFDYIWRCSDDDDGDYNYALRHIQPRLQLYYDVLNKKVSVRIVQKYQETMTEYLTKARLLRQKQALLESDDDDYDDDDDSDQDTESDEDNGSDHQDTVQYGVCHKVDRNQNDVTDSVIRIDSDVTYEGSTVNFPNCLDYDKDNCCRNENVVDCDNGIGIGKNDGNVGVTTAKDGDSDIHMNESGDAKASDNDKDVANAGDVSKDSDSINGNDAVTRSDSDGDKHVVLVKKDDIFKDGDGVDGSATAKGPVRKQRSTEIDELEMVEMTRLWKDLTRLEDTLEMMENPVMRYLTDIGETDRKNNQTSTEEIRHTRQHKERVTHIVGERITVSGLQDLLLPGDTIIETHPTPASAITGCYDDDTILILPGSYSGDCFNRLSKSVTIQGIGNPESVVINCKLSCDDDPCSICCSADPLTIRNLTFLEESTDAGDNLSGEPSDGTRLGAVLQVRDGKTRLTDCRFQCQSTGIAPEHCHLTMDKCDIVSTQAPGVALQNGANVLMKSCHIHDCGQNAPAKADQMCGVLITSPEVVENDPAKCRPSLTMEDCTVEHNQGPGIRLHILSKKTQQEAQEVSVDDLCTLTSGNLQLTNSSLSSNAQGIAMVSFHKMFDLATTEDVQF